jgi:hypothetical protein
MDNFIGTIIEESLEDKSVLNDVKIISTKIEPLNDRHQTSWVTQWTLHKVEVDVDKAEDIAGKISKALDSNHTHSWYADFKNETIHYYIFRDKVFKVDRTKIEEYQEAQDYGLRLGIPSFQVEFVKNVVK